MSEQPQLDVTASAPNWGPSYNFNAVQDPNSLPAGDPKARTDLIRAYYDGTATAKWLQDCLNYLDKDMNVVKALLCRAAYADYQEAHGGVGYYGSIKNAPADWPPSSQNMLTDKAFAPLAALYHYAFGDGSAMAVDLGQLSFNFDRNNLPPINNILSGVHTGEFNINQSIGYDFATSDRWAWSYLGRVSLNLSGTLKVDPAGNWNFDGRVNGVSDRYDANPDAKRGQIGELLTQILARIPNHTEYEIFMQGEHRIQISGTR